MFFGDNLRIESWIFDLIFGIFFILILWEARKMLGREKTSLFLWGSILWTLTVENIMVALGNYDYFSYANYYTFGGKLIDGYPGWVCFVVFVPLNISLGWFLLSFPAFVMADRVLANRNIWLKSTLAAVMLISFDLLMDPISVVNEWWRWTGPGYYLRGVNIGNYIGWFFMLFYFSAIYERTVVERGGFKWLRPLEKLFFRNNTMKMADIDLWKVRRVLYFRTVVFLPIMIASTIMVSAIATTGSSNRYAPFNNVMGANYEKQYPASARPAGAPHVVLPDNDIRKVKGPRNKIKNFIPEMNKEGVYESHQ
jgi:uncharacterized membrane protein